MSLLPIRDLRSFLDDPWSLSRKIRDFRAGVRGAVEGAARFRRAGDDLLYEESGRLNLGDYEGTAVRAYRYLFPVPERARVCFADGGFFHELGLGNGWCEAVHLCGGDRYAARFEVLSPEAWRVVWRIRGPRKDLLIESRYGRCPQ